MEHKYKSGNLPLYDHVHDDASQDLSFFRAAEKTLQSEQRSHGTGLSEDMERMEGDSSLPSDLSPYKGGGSSSGIVPRTPYVVRWWDLVRPYGSDGKEKEE